MHLFALSNLHITPAHLPWILTIAKGENNQSDTSITLMLCRQGGFFWALTQSHLFYCTDHGKIIVQHKSGAYQAQTMPNYWRLIAVYSTVAN